ncbi:hypothetical protein ID866_7901 [Astraeus odoratus]|nr:hypothetical protein ID866_7901 [Astraeus odoratus]
MARSDGAAPGVLPSAIFLTLSAAAFYLLFVQSILHSHVTDKVAVTCHTPLDGASSPLRLEYTGYPELDKLVCCVGFFFHTAMTPFYRPLLAELLGAVAAPVIITFAEAARDKRPFLLGLPAAIWVLAQLMSLALVMALYSLAAIVTGVTGRKPGPTSGAKINQGNAEALLFGLIVGYIIPSACMVALEDPIVTAIWQVFPLIMQVATLLHRIIRPPSRLIESGYYTVQATFATVFLGSAAIHIHYIWPLCSDTDTLKQVLIPSFGLNYLAAAPPVDSVIEFLKWDLAIGMVSTFFLVLWFADNFFQCLVIIVWCISTTIVLGPGAAISSILMWREEKLNRPSHIPTVQKED